MERDDYVDGIRSAWLGEQFGEVFFTQMAAQATDANLKSKWQRLANLEQVTGSKMADVLSAHGAATTIERAVEVDDSVMDRYTEASHQDAMLRMKSVVEKAVVHFDQLLAVAPDDDVPAVQFLVQHELALLSFVERELEGDTVHSLDAVEDLLRQV